MGKKTTDGPQCGKEKLYKTCYLCTLSLLLSTERKPKKMWICVLFFGCEIFLTKSRKLWKQLQSTAKWAIPLALSQVPLITV